jgi:uncharacterized protein
MSRLRRSRRNKDPYKKRALILFAAGVAVGLAISIIFCRVGKTPHVSVKKGLPVRPAPVSLPVVPPPMKAKRPLIPKVAIVLDDFGYNYRNVEAVFNIKRPITFSILPGHAHSKSIARRVSQKGYEEILHLPLEPHENDKYARPELNTITVDIKREELLNKLSKALEDVPYADGISNHQGSKATEDVVIMRAIFTELKKRDLFFLDSLVTNKSVCKRLAGDIGIGFVQRDVFLDNEEDFAYIKGQMQQLIRKAKRKGAAIGIGHDREKTVSALSVLIPEAEKEGVEFVFLSELIK